MAMSSSGRAGHSERPTARESGSRASFSRESRSIALQGKGSQVPLATAARVLRAGDELRAKMQAHHEKHANAWVTKRYGEMLRKGGPASALTLKGASDPRAVMMNRARDGVAAQKARRIERVSRAQANMLRTGQVRANRKVDWQRGLGE